MRNKEKRHARRASTSVFLMIILSSMIALTFAFVSCALKTAGIGYSDSVLFLAGRSVLSGYDVHLKDDYGLMAFRGLGPEMSKRVEYFASYTFDRNRYIDLERVEADSGGMSLADTSAFEKEVLGYAKFAVARDIISPGDDEGGSEPGQLIPGASAERTLRNGKVISSLPSGGSPGSGGIAGAAGNLISSDENIFRQGTDAWLMLGYIMLKFGNAEGGRAQDSFFMNEAEYILEGEMSDEENYKEFKKDVLKIRNAANLAHIWLDPEMRAKVQAVCEAATPGPWSALTAAAVSEAWAYAESVNDVKLLEHGKKVAIKKTKQTWAIDIESLTEDMDVGYIDTGSAAGLGYKDYLKLLLAAEDRSRKLL
ncbi:MAG: hypothetical protein II696_01080, partial [Firmicutes bacterium]|nr:hypothetical protein [Bacillota bacterium]